MNNNNPRNVIAPRNDDQRGGRNDNDRRRQEEMHGNRQRPRQRRQTRPEKVYEKSERRLNEPGPTYILGIDRTFANQDEFWKKLANLPKTINLTVKSFKTNSESATTSIFIHFQSNAAYREFHRYMRNNRRLGFHYRFLREKVHNVSQQFIESNLQNIHERTESILRLHREKIENVQVELRNLTKTHGCLNHENMRIQKRALESKVLEFEGQRNEFERKIRHIKQVLENLEGFRAKQEDVDNLLKQFEIEYTRLEQALPIYAQRSLITDTVLHNQVCIVLGETGSGKSTQMVQYLLDTNLSEDGNIACTQPRKVAAASLAQRVASEMKSNVGNIVGYKCGLHTKVSLHTKILYMTDYMLLNECLNDPLLNNYSCIVIDEAHERSLYTDLLLGMIKKCLPLRPDLHIVVTSATIDPDLFVRFFREQRECPVLRVSGRMFPVDIEWLPISNTEDFPGDYERWTAEKILEIHNEGEPGDILAFLTGQLEIERCIETLEMDLKGREDYVMLPLHGKLQIEEQNKIFKDAPHGKRKIVISTNVAETSVTIPGVKYVVDSGLAKEMIYDPERKVSSLRVIQITKSSADQRKGRAGRTAPGKCFRLYSKQEYDAMPTVASPEILRIHLGHAILKLLQLNVDPLEFDFVQEPPRNSMEMAFRQLVKLKAVENRKITKLGKWIAKLPFEPNLGVFVHNALDSDIGFEAIVIASSCTTIGSLFYRAGTQCEKDVSDKLKVQFCHRKGDYFTYLNVYRAWSAIQEKEKGKWCKDNSINGRAIRNIRDTMNEIRLILKKEMLCTVTFKETGGERDHRILQKLLFQAFEGNLCHYLGHEKAGYHFIDKNQQVFIHPSSSFLYLASCPDWVIVEKILNTSREYAVNITEVLEEDVTEAIANGDLTLDIEDVTGKRVEMIYREFVGTRLYAHFVGPRHFKVKELESALKTQNDNSVFIIDANRNKGEISIYAPAEKDHVAAITLQSAMTPIRKAIRTEVVEFPIVPRCQNVRVSVGPGGVVQDVLCQTEFRSVYVYCTDSVFGSDDDMIRWFGRFGAVEGIKQKSPNNKNPNYRGEIMYEKSESAKAAVDGTKDNPRGISARPPMGAGKAGDSELFKAKVTWCRRKSRGFGFIKINNPVTLSTILLSNALISKLSFGRSRVTIKRNRENNDELFIKGLNPLVNEEVLREYLLESYPMTDDEITKIVVIREKVDPSQELQILDTFKRRLVRQFEQEIAKNRFRVLLNDPRKGDNSYEACVTFNDPEEGFEACAKLNKCFMINDNVVSVIPEIHCRISVLDLVFKRIEKEFNAFCDKVKAEMSGVRIQVTAVRYGNRFIDIDAESIDGMMETRRQIVELLQEEKLDMERVPSLRMMFTRDGRQKIQKIMEKTRTLIVLDDRNTTVSIHGNKEDRNVAFTKIQKYISKLSSSKLTTLDLKGESRPPGLMRAVILAYGIDLLGLKQSCELKSIELDHRNHRIKMLGSEEAIQHAMQNVEELEETVRGKSDDRTPSTEPECGVCFSEIPDSDLYRLESCGHPYCRDCVKLHIESVISARDFPIKCCHEDCDELWALADVRNMSKMGMCTMQTVLNSSISCFVAANKDKARYCITPDCQMVYKVSKTGARFVCFLCQMSICCCCHVEYHTGMSCAKYKMEKGIDDNGIREWMRRDPQNRSCCPNCFMGIEKFGGCQHMECRACKVHICWTCKEFFKTSRKCYGHMNEKHNSFV